MRAFRVKMPLQNEKNLLLGDYLMDRQEWKHNS